MQLLNCFAKSLKSWQKKYSVTGQVPLMVGIFTLGLIAYNSNLIQASEYKQQVKGQRIKLTLALPTEAPRSLLGAWDEWRVS